MAANQLSEQEIQFRKRARRRLVGAIALVLLMVTVLPMILDDREVKPSQQDIAISIPSQDGGDFTSRIVPVTPQSVSAPVELAPPLEKPKAVSVPVSKPDSTPVKPVHEKPAPEAKSLAVPTKAAETTSKAVETSAKPVETASVEKTVAKPASSVQKPNAKKGAFTVQIGVFTEGPKLSELEGKLAAQGFHVSKEKLETPKGPKIRLRTGSFATRGEAETALNKLKAAGVAAMIVANK